MALNGEGLSRQQRRARERALQKSQRSQRRIAPGALAIGAMLAAGSAAANTFVVSNLNDSGSGSLRDAVTQANALAGADVITFQAGLTGTITLTSGEIPITDSVTINGPGQAAITVSGNSSSRILNIENSGATTPIDVNVNNLTISKGSSSAEGAAIRDNSENLTLDHITINSSNAGTDGGGLWFSGQNVASLTITNSTITGNTSSLNGGGIAATYVAAPLAISNTTISNNHAYGGNGAGISIDNNAAQVTINNSIITGNAVGEGSAGGVYLRYAYGPVSITNSSITNNDGGGFGGGVEAAYMYASLYLAHDTISGNTAGYAGGGIVAVMAKGNTFTLQNSIVSNNTSGTFPYISGYGGGIAAFGYGVPANVLIADSVITGNVGDPNDPLSTPANGTNNYDVGYGGGLNLSNVAATMQRTTISGNTAYAGAGIYLTSGATLTATDVTIANNTANSPETPAAGGGITVVSSQLSLLESTLVGNSAQTGGGGIEVCSCGPSTVTLDNAVVANNTAAAGTTPDINSPTGVTANYSLIKTPGTTTITGANNLTGVDPNLGALANNNSSVLAGDPNATQQHPQTMLQICPSPVINAGDPAFTPPPSTDERGLPRVSGGRIDMGAAELQSGTIQFTTAAQSVNGDAPNTLTVTASRSGGSEGATQVSYATANGTATAGTDFTATSGTLSWADADAANKTFTVAILHDPLYDPNETFTVALTSPTCGATLGANVTQTETITESVQPALSINNVSQNEGNSGTTAFTFTVTLSEPSALTTTVHYATADGTATAGSDYTAASGTLTFNPGVTTQTITVNVTGDTVCEPNETFTVNLSTPTNATIANGTGTGTIVNDDPCNADLSITKTANGQFFAGNSATYTIHVTNNGPATANAPVVTDTLPASVSLTSATPSQGTCSGTTTVTCNLGPLVAGSTATITLQVMPTSTGSANNTATVSAGAQTDPTPVNNSASAAMTVLPAADIPTLGETMLMLLGAMLAAIGAWFTRK